MRTQPTIALVLSAVVLFSMPGCPKPQDTLQTLQKEVSAYAAAPTDEAAAKIDEGFTRLDSQVAKIRADGKTAEAGSLGQQRDALQAQYTAARMTASLLKAKEAAANVGKAFREAGEAFGQALQDGSTNND
jgi:uncharacterized lipoprotein YajG